MSDNGSFEALNRRKALITRRSGKYFAASTTVVGIAAGSIAAFSAHGSAESMSRLTAEGMIATVSFTGVPDGQPCAAVAWDSAKFAVADLDTSEKLAAALDRAVTAPAPQFAMTESGSVGLKLDFAQGAGAGTYIVAAECSSLEDGSPITFIVDKLTVSGPNTGSAGGSVGQGSFFGS